MSTRYASTQLYYVEFFLDDFGLSPQNSYFFKNVNEFEKIFKVKLFEEPSATGKIFTTHNLT